MNDFAKIDNDRKERCGFPEFIYGEGKSLEQLVEIIKIIQESGENVLATKVDAEIAENLIKQYPQANYDDLSKTLRIQQNETLLESDIVIATGGTTDLPVAYEAKRTIEACGFKATLLADVGVAGIHRLLSNKDILNKAKVIIAIAGMEGALPSVIGGLVSCPVIAVPTSVGYGASLGGMTAMFAMLNSCASGITVVNINNGFGAACSAVRMINTFRK